MQNKKTEVKILDCTTRDGGYLNNWNFEKKFVREIYRALSKAGVDYYEIGYRGTEKYFNPKDFGLWRFSSERDIREAVGGISGPDIAIMADYGKIELKDFLPREKSIVSMVRLASHKNNLVPALKFLRQIKKIGYQTSLQAMGYSSYSEKERKEFAKLVSSEDIDYVYVADTYGSFFPDEIERILEPLLRFKNRIKIGFHPHNSLQMAFANSIEAIRYGVDIIDCSMFGMGRGAGNLPTEIILAYLHDKVPDKFNVIPVLDCIDKYFITMQKKIGWGYQLAYMLSGLFQCHPSYSQKLVNFKEFTMEDIWRALECIKKRSPTGFSESLLNEIVSLGIVGGIRASGNKGRQIRKQPVTSGGATPAYLDRHKGSTFLILGNGPSLKEYQNEIRQFIKKYKPVVMGANYLGGLFVPDYHAFSNKRRFVSYIDTVAPGSKLLISKYISEGMIREYTHRDYEKIEYIDTLNNDFDICNGVVQCNCRTVSVLLMGAAVVMGAERIFCVGTDGYLNLDEHGNPLFYEETDEKEEGDLIIDMHKWNHKFIGQINNYLLKNGREGIHILTPTSYREFYKGIKNYI
jgi:4-hydroxy 2-oxovalerate aldolase